MQTRGATRAFSALLPLLLLATSSLVFAVTAEDSSSSPAASPRHFVVDARDVLADPKAAFLSWAAHVSRPVMLLPVPSSSSSKMEDGNGNLSEEEEEEEEKAAAAAAAAAPLPAGPRDCSRRWSPADRARFDAWTSSVLPRARGAIERAFDDGSEKGGEDSLELPLPFASKPLPLEVNGIADLPLSALRAGLLPAHLNAEAAKEGGGEGFGLDAVAARLAEWLRFPYAAEAVLDAAAASLAAASSGEEQEEEDPLSLSLLPSLFKRRRRHPKRPLPASVDWSTEGVLGPVKNQHINGTPCGCCWAFATTGVVEGIVGVVSGKRPPSLSEQQLIDCDRGGPFDDLGCEGGSVEGGVHYIVENQGRLDSEEDYPYSGIDKGEAACLRKKAKQSALEGSGARVSSFHNVPKKSEAALKAAVARHPVAVAVCCGDFIDDWHAYTGGIMTFNGTIEGCPKPLDHAVVVVGYGSGAKDPTDPSGKRELDYWIVKNSWGEEWGEKGFFKLARGLDSGEFPKGAAGLLSMPNFPVAERE